MCRLAGLLLIVAVMLPAVSRADDWDAMAASKLADDFIASVDRRIEPTPEERDRYSQLLDQALAEAGLSGLTPQLLLMVDRSPQVQAALLIWWPGRAPVQWIGATPVSTGKPGHYDYFPTPLGVFRHDPGNPDFRAEGTRNDNGILGYGPIGTRVFDFGWQVAERGWGNGGASLMRLQVHATDPGLLEPGLGVRRSKGCIRIPLSLNRFLDQRGILDADYERAAAAGMKIWVWTADRRPTSGAGRYLVVVESQREARPAWSPAPASGAD